MNLYWCVLLFVIVKCVTSEGYWRQSVHYQPYQHPNFYRQQPYYGPQATVPSYVQSYQPIQHYPPVQQQYAPVQQQYPPVQQQYAPVQQQYSPVQQQYPHIQQYQPYQHPQQPLFSQPPPVYPHSPPPGPFHQGSSVTFSTFGNGKPEWKSWSWHSAPQYAGPQQFHQPYGNPYYNQPHPGPQYYQPY